MDEYKNVENILSKSDEEWMDMIDSGGINAVVPQSLIDCPYLTVAESGKCFPYGIHIPVRVELGKIKRLFNEDSLFIENWTESSVMKGVLDMLSRTCYNIDEVWFGVLWKGKATAQSLRSFPRGLIALNIPWNLDGYIYMSVVFAFLLNAISHVIVIYFLWFFRGAASASN